MDKSFSRRLRLNNAILNNLYHVLPVDDKGHENYMPVGRGIKSSPYCGRHVGYNICPNKEAHKGFSLHGEDCTGKLIVAHKHLWCHKSSCPVCFIRGWSVRGARNIVGRLNAGAKRGLGKVEHIVVSPPESDRDLPESIMRKTSRDALIVRGIVGGGMIFHGYRMDRKRGVLVWSPHYHVLGFILGGYGKCRGCKKVCLMHPECNGFEKRTRKFYKTDGFIVKVFAERETAFGTAFYQLNHATIRLGIKRFHAVTWFGVCGNRKFKSDKLKAEAVCIACGEEMKRAIYVGKRHIVKDVGHPAYVPVFPLDEFDEDGEPNFIDFIGGKG